MQYKIIQKTHWQAQKIVFSYKCFGQQYKDFVVLHIAFVFRSQLGFKLGFSRLYSKLSVVKYNVTVKFGTNCLELTPWKFIPFGFSSGSVVNYKLLRASYKSMESMEIIFHSECFTTPSKSIIHRMYSIYANQSQDQGTNFFLTTELILRL